MAVLNKYVNNKSLGDSIESPENNPIISNNVWKTASGKEIAVADRIDEHLKNCLQFVKSKSKHWESVFKKEIEKRKRGREKKMETENKKTFRKGDIVKNCCVGKGNPDRYLLYIGKCTIRHGRYNTSKGYLCRNWEGEDIELSREYDPLEYVGHMDAFESFMAELKKLKEMEKEFDQ